MKASAASTNSPQLPLSISEPYRDTLFIYRVKLVYDKVTGDISPWKRCALSTFAPYQQDGDMGVIGHFVNPEWSTDDVSDGTPASGSNELRGAGEKVLH